MSLDLLQGLLAPYQGGGTDLGTESPLLALALQAAMGGGGQASPGIGAIPSGGGAPVSGQLGDWIRRAEQITGVGGDWTKGLDILVQHESGGNPRAVNQTPVPSGQHAMGLAQTIPSTFAAYDMPRLGGILNPISNLVAAIRYIQSRYGSVYNTPGVSSILHGGDYRPY